MFVVKIKDKIVFKNDSYVAVYDLKFNREYFRKFKNLSPIETVGYQKKLAIAKFESVHGNGKDFFLNFSNKIVELKVDDIRNVNEKDVQFFISLYHNVVDEYYYKTILTEFLYNEILHKLHDDDIILDGHLRGKLLKIYKKGRIWIQTESNTHCLTDKNNNNHIQLANILYQNRVVKWNDENLSYYKVFKADKIYCKESMKLACIAVEDNGVYFKKLKSDDIFFYTKLSDFIGLKLDDSESNVNSNETFNDSFINQLDVKDGYHVTPIKKGILGESSKIQEELDELIDAEKQDNKILALVELSDIIGAIKMYLNKHHSSISITDLLKMSDATERSFKSGERK